jgi:hypothetical protein
MLFKSYSLDSSNASVLCALRSHVQQLVLLYRALHDQQIIHVACILAHLHVKELLLACVFLCESFGAQPEQCGSVHRSPRRC